MGTAWRCASASQDGTARLWDAATGQELLLLKPEGGAGLVDVAFSPEGKMLATSAPDAVRVFLLEINDLVDLANARLSRNFTPEECDRFISTSPCENLLSSSPTPEPPVEIGGTERICLVTDHIGITPYGLFHQAYVGLIKAADRYDLDWKVFIPEAFDPLVHVLESTLGAECDLIASLGSIFEDADKDIARQQPGQFFLFLDEYFDQPLENVRTVWYNSDQGGFLAGYLAAAMTQTGMVGTFGGHKGPIVTDLMDGFEAGIRYYNQKYTAEVHLLGWDAATHEGYIAAFVDDEKGYQYAQLLLEQGADIIFPVAAIQIFSLNSLISS
jgi:hypothetical protein